jgi:hypothetical protein
MAAREFHGLIKNEWENPLFHSADDVDGGDWQDPWYPSRVPGAGKIRVCPTFYTSGSSAM